MMQYLRFALVSLFVTAGVLSLLVALLGVYRFRFVLNRMHAAAVGDTLGMMLILTGLMICQGFNWATVKMLLIIVIMWTTSPVAGHLLAQLECETDEELSEHLIRINHKEDDHADL